MEVPEKINELTPEEIKARLRAFVENWYNPSSDVWKNGQYALAAATAYIELLEEQAMCMQIQMRGDCGVCKHKDNGERCAACLSDTYKHHMTHPLWEYEGLPEVKNHA